VQFIKVSADLYWRVDTTTSVAWKTYNTGSGGTPWEFRIDNNVITAHATQAEAQADLAAATKDLGEVVEL